MSSNTADDIDLESIEEQLQKAANIVDEKIAKNDTTTIKPATFKLTPHTLSFHNHSTDNPCTETGCEVCRSSRYLSVVSGVKYEQPIMSMKQYPSTTQQMQQLQKEHPLVHDILYTFAKGRAEDLPGGKVKVCPKWEKRQNTGSNVDEPRESNGGDEEEEGNGDVNSHPIYGQEYDTATIPSDVIIFSFRQLSEAALHCPGNIELWKKIVDELVNFVKLVASPQNPDSKDHSWKKVEGVRVEDIVDAKNVVDGLSVDTTNNGGGTINRIRYRKGLDITINRGDLKDPQFMDYAKKVAKHLNGLSKKDKKNKADAIKALREVGLDEPPGGSVTREKFNKKVYTFINERIIEPLIGMGFVFVFVDQKAKVYSEMKLVGSSYKDKDTIIGNVFRRMQSFEGRKTNTTEVFAEAAVKRKKELCKEIDKLDSVKGNALGTLNPGFKSYIHRVLNDETVGDDGCYEGDYEKYTNNLKADIQRQKERDEKVKGKLKVEPNQHISTAQAMINNPIMIELFLAWEKKNAGKRRGRTKELYGSIRKLMPFLPEDLSTLSADKGTKLVCKLLSTVMKVLCVQDYFSDRTVDASKGTQSFDQFAWDHLPCYNKHMIISEMTSVTDLLLEILKCRLIHMGSHQLGSKHTARYDNQLAIPPVLVYGNKFGTEHRDVKQILQLYEVQYFLACGKACGGFNGRATLKALEVLVYNCFGICPQDVFPFTSEKKSYNTTNIKVQCKNGQCQTRRIFWNRTFTQILVKLAIRCKGTTTTNYKCDECFLNRHPLTRSGAHHHHQIKRASHNLLTFARAEKLYIDSYIDQLIKGDAAGLCAGCHMGIETRAGN